ncbi:hypothetical protein ACIQGZ_11775 [Streptomyces sp. NPDC092296]|uniref:hypothetical protein n=1 Tax=Streptomyces sp. NPDC092296 TaxID=3366012 RepID=UPI0037F4B32E
MTAPNTPPGPGQPPVPGDSPPGASQVPPPPPPPSAAWPQPPAPGADGGYGPPAYPGFLVPAPADTPPRRPGVEIRIGVLVAVGSALAGLLMGLLWLWLAPKVPLYADSKAVYLKDPEGEQRIGADGVFVLLGLGAGALAALVAFLCTRRRGGGVAVSVGLAVGGLLGSVIAWRLGTALGPTGDIVAHARQVGQGKVFDAALELSAKGALLVWSMAAMVVLLGLTAAFGKREPQPAPYWQGAPPPPPPASWPTQ